MRVRDNDLCSGWVDGDRALVVVLLLRSLN